MRRPVDGAEHGAAVVDFVLVTVLLLFLFLLVFQVGVFFHVRNVVAASAAEGARYGAAANRTPAQGASRAQQSIAEALGGRLARQIRCLPNNGTGIVRVAGEPAVDIVCTGRVPVVFGPSPTIVISVHGHALEESR
jgi:Flp pilus assembly protein TadG